MTDQSETKKRKIESTHFVFEHKLFQVEGAYFRLTHDTKEPAYFVPLGDQRGALPISSLSDEFGIDPDSPDGMMLKTVEEGLRFVKDIRPGDDIPNEILDGSASWSVDDRHLAIARSRLTVQISSWLTGHESVVVDSEQLLMLAEDPNTKKRVQEGFQEMADQMGVTREQVVQRIEDMERELAYIEALRERFNLVLKIQRNIKMLSKVYARDRSIVEEIFRLAALIKTPIATFTDIIDQVDAQTGEILTVIKKFSAQVEFIRDMRDELHFMMMDWDVMIDRWEGEALEKGDSTEILIRDTYRFLAQRFAPSVQWTLSAR